MHKDSFRTPFIILLVIIFPFTYQFGAHDEMSDINLFSHGKKFEVQDLIDQEFGNEDPIWADFPSISISLSFVEHFRGPNPISFSVFLPSDQTLSILRC